MKTPQSTAVALSDDDLLALIQTPASNIVVLPQPQPPDQAPTPSGKKPRLDFGGIKEKKPTESKRTEYPELPDPDGKIATQASAFLVAHAQEEAAKGAKEAARAELIKTVRPFHYRVNQGRGDVQNAVSVHCPEGDVMVTFKDAYKKLGEGKYGEIAACIGGGVAEQYLSQSFEFTIKSEKIPEDKMQDVIDAVNELAQRLGIGNAIEVTKCFKPTAEWHSARYRVLTPEQNLKLEEMVDKEKGFCTVAVGPARGGKK